MAIHLLLALVGLSAVADAAKVHLHNQASVDMDVFWRDENRGSYNRLITIEKGTEGALNTFEGHKFLIVERGRPVNFVQDQPNHVQRLCEEVRTDQMSPIAIIVGSSPIHKKKRAAGGGHTADGWGCEGPITQVPRVDQFIGAPHTTLSGPSAHSPPLGSPGWQDLTIMGSTDGLGIVKPEAPTPIARPPRGNHSAPAIAAPQASVMIRNHVGISINVWWRNHHERKYIKLVSGKEELCRGGTLRSSRSPRVVIYMMMFGGV
jgi:hypothetical protein